MPKSDEMTIKLKRDYHEVDDYENTINSELERILGTDDFDSFQLPQRTKLAVKKKNVKATVSIHEDGPIFGMSVADAVSIASGIATLVSLWLQLQTPQPKSQGVTQDHYIVITNGKNTFRGKPGKKHLKQIVELMAKIDR